MMQGHRGSGAQGGTWPSLGVQGGLPGGGLQEMEKKCKAEGLGGKLVGAGCRG